MKTKSSLVVLVVLVGLVGVTKAWQQTQKPPQTPAAKAPAKPVARKPALVLNEDSATALIKEALQNERYMVSTAAVLPLMSQSTTDYTAFGGENADAPIFLLMRLIGEGFVKKEVRVDSYPVISGAWAGENTCVDQVPGEPNEPAARIDWMLKNQNTRCEGRQTKMQLQMVPNSNRLTGTTLHRFAPRVEGTITTDDKVKLNGEIYMGGGFVTDGSWTYIERGQSAYLVSNRDYSRQEGSVNPNYLDSGTASGKRIEVKMYKYAFIPALGESPRQVPAGRFEVGAVSNLLLSIETRAAANFTWRVLLDGLGQVMLEKPSEVNTVPDGIGTADFAKKPDATWVLVTPLRF